MLLGGGDVWVKKTFIRGVKSLETVSSPLIFTSFFSGGIKIGTLELTSV